MEKDKPDPRPDFQKEVEADPDKFAEKWGVDTPEPPETQDPAAPGKSH